MSFRYVLAVFAVLILSVSSLFSKELGIAALPTFLDSTNAGIEFYFSFPPCYEEESAGYMNSCRVFVCSAVKQEVTLEIPGKAVKMTKLCNANDVVEFVLGTGAAQPYVKAGRSPAPEEQVYGEAAVHVTASSPIVCYGVTRYNYTSDGFLAIPVSSLGKDYIVSSYPQYTAIGSGYQLVSMTTISAAYDGTTVYFEMGGTASSETSGGLKPGQVSHEFVLAKKGDVLCFASNGDLQDLSGSRITSNKPVAVVSGNQCANVPAGVYACDYISEMELPTFTWGKEYHVTPIYGRKKNPIIRIYAKEKYTRVYRDGQEWFVIRGSSGKIDDGFVERRAFDGDPKAVVITADKPISVSMYNPGQADDNVSNDPFQIALTPFEQYQTEITWCTPGAISSNNNFKIHYLNLVYQLSPDGSIPDDLEFAVAVNGKFEWKKLSTRFGSTPGYLFSIPVNGNKYACKQLVLPGDNTYSIRAKTPFAAYAYGFSNYDSYGMPASVGLKNIQQPVIVSNNDVQAPLPTWTMSCDGSVNNGMVTDIPNDSLKRSNLGVVFMVEASSSNYVFSYDSTKTFIPGKSKSTDWKLKVIDKSKDAHATIVFADQVGNDTIITVEFKALKLYVESGNPVELGIVKRGETKTADVTIINGGTSAITITRLELKEKTRGFKILNTTALPFVLKPSFNFSIKIEFTNLQDSLYLDEIGIGDECVFSYISTIKAEIITPVISVDNLDCGKCAVGKKVEGRQFRVQNQSMSDLILTGDDHLTALAGTPFSARNWQIQYPYTLKALKGVSLYIDFIPTKAGSFSAKVTFSSDAVTSDSTLELTGATIPTDAFESEENPSSILCKLTPQPIRDNATFEVTMPNSQRVTITIINMLGQKVVRIAENMMLETGVHTFPISTSGYSNGNYTIEIRPEGGDVVIQKMTVVR